MRSDGQYKDTVQQDMSALGLDRYRRRFQLTHRIAFFEYRLRTTEHLRRQARGSRNPILWLAYYISRVHYEFLSERMGFSIPLGVFGPGLSIAHRGAIVVNGKAVIGARCRIHPGVTIGAVRDGAPTVGDDVFIGPNAGIYGSVTVGDSAKIGPHCLVRRSIDPGRTVVSSEAQVLE